MVEYKCKKCLKIFTRKGDYDRHLMRKTPCSVKKSHTKIITYKCKTCDKKFNRKDHFKRHIIICC